MEWDGMEKKWDEGVLSATCVVGRESLQGKRGLKSARNGRIFVGKTKRNSNFKSV